MFPRDDEGKGEKRQQGDNCVVKCDGPFYTRA
jgi:hypothetical protein